MNVLSSMLARSPGSLAAVFVATTGCNLLPELTPASKTYDAGVVMAPEAGIADSGACPVPHDADDGEPAADTDGGPTPRAAGGTAPPTCVPATEVCNGLDDDCDGLPDYSFTSGRVESACVCLGLDARPQMVRAGQAEAAATDSTCAATADGIAMTYRLGSCSQPFPWAQCAFDSVSLNRFDADHQGKNAAPGALEIHFCISTAVTGALNLYYGEYPRRKRLRLLQASESSDGLAAGCYSRFFAPTDAECPVYPGPISDNDLASELDDGCQDGCELGLWSRGNTACRFDYDDVPLYVTAEFCEPGRDDGTVELSQLRMRYHGDTCMCAGDKDCKDVSKPVCDVNASLPHTDCDAASPRCGGVCTAQ